MLLLKVRLSTRMRQPLPCLGFAGIAALTAGALPAQPSNTVTGTLVDDRDAPAAGIEVVLRPHPSAFEADLYLLGHSDALPEAVDRVRSDTNGAYSVSAPAAGPYRLEFGRSAAPNEPGNAMPLVQGAIVPLKGSRVVQTVDVPERHLVAVRVLDTDDRPIAGALIVANPADMTPPRAAAAFARMILDRTSGNHSPPAPEHLMRTYHPSASRTDAEGIARLAMPTADATVIVSASGFVLGKGETKSGRAALRLAADPGVRLRVRGPTGAPVPGAAIRTAGARDRIGNSGAPTARRTLATPAALGGLDTPLAITDENGEAVVGRTPGAETGLEVEAADGAFAQLYLPAANAADSAEPQHIIDVRLEDPLRVPGRIVDAASGLPIRGAAIWADLFPGHNAFSDSTGAFDLNIRPAPRGTRLRVTANGFLPERIHIGAADLFNRDEVRIGLTPSAPIRGVVTDDAGQPVAGARIRAEPRGDDAPSTSSFGSGPATSGLDGAFHVAEALYGYAYRLTAQAAGYASSVLDVPPVEAGVAVDPVHLVLTKGRRVVGAVVDTDGHPVAKAEVSLLWPLDPSEFRSLSDSPATAATTDAQGAFALPATAPGEYEVDVRHSAYAQRPTTSVAVPDGESDFEIGPLTLIAGAAIHGIVTGPDGRPAADATIESVGQYRTGGAPTRTATSDVDGRFRIEGLSSDLVHLGVRASGYPILTRGNVRTNNDDPVLFELEPGASLTGRVLDSGGNGVAGIPVSLGFDHGPFADDDWLLWNAEDTDPQRMTDAGGRFRFEGLMAGTWSAEATKGTESARLDAIALTPGAEREIELLLQTRHRLTVIVTTDAGEPVAQAQIRARSPGDLLSSASYGRTDGSGRTEMDIDPGPATVEVSHRKLRDASREVQLEPGDNELSFELEPGLEIGGTVRSYDGAPLALATVEADTEYSRDIDSHRTNTVSDRNGAFRLTGLEARRYILTARASGYADGGPDEPIEVGDAAIGGIEIVLEPEVSIAGVVTGLSPSDLSQAEIHVRNGPRSRSASVDSEGNFSVRGIGPGTWDVMAIKGEWERTVERTVTIERGAAEVFVELPFERGLRLSGQVLEDGAPLGGARLFVGDHETRADQEGRFAMEGLDPGPQEVVVNRADYSGTQYRSIDLQTDLEGVLIELQPAVATVAGVVVDAGTGQPLEFASLTAADAATIGALAADGGGAPLVGASSSLSLDAGRFTLELRPNADHVWVTRYGYESARIPLNIAPGEHREGLVIRLQPAADESSNQ